MFLNQILIYMMTKELKVPIIDFYSTSAEYSSDDIQIWFSGKSEH